MLPCGSLFRSQPAKAASAVLALLVAACGQDAPPPPPLRVMVQAVRFVDHAPDVVLTGDVAARVTSELSFKVTGQILERRAEVGDHVAADQVLATLEPQEQQADVTSAQAGIDAAEAQLRAAASTFDRQKALIGQGFTTKREYDQAESGLLTAQGALETARSALGNARDQLEQTTMRPGAPGVLTARRAEAGEVVQAAQAVFVLAQDGPRDAIFNVQEAIFLREPDKQGVRVALVADPTIERPAKLREIAPAVDQSTGTVRMKFEIEDPPPEMTLGAPIMGTGRFAAEHVAILPWTALSVDAGHPAVWLLDPKDRTVSLRRVDVAAYETGRVVLRGGVEPGQMVVTRGQQLLRPGQVVEPVQAPPS